MTITICPIALKEAGKCRDAQCHLRHDVTYCKPCKCFVLHGELVKHRRGEDHRRKCGFGSWKTDAKRPALVVLPTPFSRARTKQAHPLKSKSKSKSTKKRASTFVSEARQRGKRACRRTRRKKLTGELPPRGGEERHLFVSREDGLDFKSGVDIGIGKKKKKSIPIVIRKT